MRDDSFPRTLGVPGDDTPRIGESTARSTVSRDLSLEATPASEDLRNALCVLDPIQDSMLREALTRLITNALRKIEAPRVAA